MAGVHVWSLLRKVLMFYFYILSFQHHADFDFLYWHLCGMEWKHPEIVNLHICSLNQLWIRVSHLCYFFSLL